MKEYSEQDWELFRQRLPKWQERHMEKLCKEYVELLNKDTQPVERFWELEERIREDTRHIGVIARTSRFNMDINIPALIEEGVITLDDLTEFSDELQSSMRAIIEKRRPAAPAGE